MKKQPLSHLHSIQVIVWDGDDVRNIWAIANIALWISGGGHSQHRAAMEVPLSEHNLGLVFRDSLHVIAPAPDQLHRRLHCFGSGVHGQEFVVAEQFGGKLSVLPKSVVVEGARGEREPCCLVSECSYDLGVCVALIEGRIATKKVVVTLALDIPHENPAAPAQSHGQGVVVVRTVLGFSLVHILRGDFQRLFDTASGTVDSVTPLTAEDRPQPPAYTPQTHSHS